MTLLSTAEQNRSLDLFYGSTGVVTGASASHELALFTDDPRLGGTELTAAGGYARVSVPNNATSWPSAASAGAKTSAVLAFPVSTGAWSDTAKWFVLYAVDSGAQADAMPLTDEIAVDAAGITKSLILTINYQQGV